MWSYAKLSKLAKALGGPEKCVQALIKSGMKKGRWQMLILLPIGVAIGVSIKPLVNYLQNKREISQLALEEAKQELIRGINEYDASQEDEM